MGRPYADRYRRARGTLRTPGRGARRGHACPLVGRSPRRPPRTRRGPMARPTRLAEDRRGTLRRGRCRPRLGFLVGWPAACSGTGQGVWVPSVSITRERHPGGRRDEHLARFITLDPIGARTLHVPNPDVAKRFATRGQQEMHRAQESAKDGCAAPMPSAVRAESLRGGRQQRSRFS
jgi:hypothetical protein